MSRPAKAARKGYFRLPSLESPALKYGYSNARVRAMKGFLIKNTLLAEMAKVDSIEAVIELLQRTAYKNDVANASAAYTGSRLVELATSRNFSRTAQKLLRMSPQSDRAALLALLLKWDLNNLKNMLHAKKLGKSYEDIRPTLLPVGGMEEEDFKRIMKADDRDIYREVRRTGLGKQLLSKEMYAQNKELWGTFKGALQSVDAFMKNESEIDTYTYLVIGDALRSTGAKEAMKMNEILQKEIDAKNILIIERLKRHGSDRARIMRSLIRGGTLSESMLNKLMEAKDLPAVVSVVRYKFPSLNISQEEADLTKLELALEKSIAAQKIDAFYTSILSIGVIIGFMLLKEEEVNDLRKIAKGKEFRMSEESIRGMLVLVG